MKLLLLLSLIILVSGDESFVAESTADGNDVSPQVTTVLQAQPSAQEVIGEKKLGKRSYSLLSVPHIRTYSPVLPVLPWYRLGGLSSHGLYGHGLYPSLGLPLSYGGLHGGWYKGWW